MNWICLWLSINSIFIIKLSSPYWSMFDIDCILHTRFNMFHYFCSPLNVSYLVVRKTATKLFGLLFSERYLFNGNSDLNLSSSTLLPGLRWSPLVARFHARKPSPVVMMFIIQFTALRYLFPYVWFVFIYVFTWINKLEIWNKLWIKQLLQNLFMGHERLNDHLKL